MCIAKTRAAPRGRNFIKASPTNCCCEHTHVCCRLNHLRAAPKDQGLQGFSRPIAAASTHMRLAKSNQGCTQGSRITRLRPTHCCCEHTHVGCRMNRLKVAPKDQALQGFGRPIAAASIHMFVARQMNQIRAAPKGRNVTSFRPTRHYCKHKYRCCRP